MEFRELQEKTFSFLGKNCKLEGKFEFSGVIKINCHMQGELKVAADGHLSIEREGLFQGTIHCQEIEIFGQFEGQILSSKKVTLWPSSQVQGQIQTPNLVIYPGAVVDIEGRTLN